MNDKFIDFLKLIEKIILFPNLTLSEQEQELIKKILVQVLDNNPNYGSQTKQAIKKILDTDIDFKTMYLVVLEYIKTHNISL